ncbi:hypothetical protein YC2023_039366 [Brassica napus]
MKTPEGSAKQRSTIGVQVLQEKSRTERSHEVVYCIVLSSSVMSTHPKGRKMLTKYVELLLAVFRHLRFLFGGLRLDANLANQLRLTGFRFWKQLGKGVNSLYLTHKTLF